MSTQPPTPVPTASPTPVPTQPGAGAGYYLSPSGNDSNAGTRAAPWLTFGKADATVAAGATVHVLAGTYQQEEGDSLAWDAGIYLGHGGTATARVTYVSDTTWGARIRSSGRGTGVRVDADYIDFVGFDVSIGSNDGTLYAGIYATGNYVRVIGNRVHDLPLDIGCGADGFGGAGIILAWSSPDTNARTRIGQVAEGNWVSNTGYASPCNASMSTVHGIYAQTRGVRIRNNVLFHNIGGYGVALNHCYTAADVSNNLFFDNGSGAVDLSADLAIGCSPNTGTRVNNNIIRDENHHSEDYGLIRDQSGGADSAANNVFHNNGAQPRTSGLNEFGSVTADPHMVTFRKDGTGDYHLTAGSPATGRGPFP